LAGKLKVETAGAIITDGCAVAFTEVSSRRAMLLGYQQVPVGYQELPVRCLEVPVRCLELPVRCLEVPVRCLEVPLRSRRVLVPTLKARTLYSKRIVAVKGREVVG
jgi:hypothetical protein